ncbi:MAG: hypothetical protein KDA78_18730 [Planctomycetaceae bacterium]|nr:hypothetical protein [Planctomycetaceae bacterium]
MSAPLETEPKPLAEPGVWGELGALFRQSRGPVILAYVLLIVENLLRLAQPFLLGLAVNGLLSNHYWGLWAFLAGHGLHMGFQFSRQMYDTRVYSRMYADRVSGLICRQREAGIPTSLVAARASLSRQFVTFVEKQIPQMVSALFSCVGAVGMLFYYDYRVVIACVLTAIPVFILNAWYSSRVKHVSRALHDRWENEIEIVEQASDAEVSDHYHRMSDCWVKMSDLEANTTGLTELFIMGLMAYALLVVCRIPEILAGDIFAVFRYLMMFVVAIDTVPRLVEQYARLKDIVRRL